MEQQTAIKIFEKKSKNALGCQRGKMVFGNCRCDYCFNQQPKSSSILERVKKRLKYEGNETVTNCNGLI